MSELELMEENRKLKQKLAEAEKENDFLKKAAVFLAKETGKYSINLLISIRTTSAYVGY